MKFQTRYEPIPADMFLAKQVHGTRALRVTQADPIEQIVLEEADAL
jgi:copper oxidase (laccase) domain-containing protein